MNTSDCWGGGYFIRQDEQGRKTVYKTDEFYPDGYDASHEIKMTDLLALAWAKENIRADMWRPMGNKTSNGPAHRYFLRSKGRYLGANDFGMRQWNDEEKRFAEADVTKIGPFISTIRQQFIRITDNLTCYSLFRKSLTGAEPKSFVKVEAQILGDLMSSQPDRMLMSKGISSSKVLRQLHFKYEAIAKRYRLLSGDPVADYQQFERISKKLESVFRVPTNAERKGSHVEFVFSEFYQRPIIMTSGFGIRESLNDVKRGVKDILGYRASQADPQTRDIIDPYYSRRGQESPYYYPNSDIYDFLKEIGSERAKEILATDDREIYRQLKGWSLLRKLGYDLSRMESDRIRKQLNEAHKIQEQWLWTYLKEREQSRIEGAAKRLGARAEGMDWEEILGIRTARNLFLEAKRMYWLARQVFAKVPGRREQDRFYTRSVDWDRYDFSEVDVPLEKLDTYLGTHGHLIAALMYAGEELSGYGTDWREQEKKSTPPIGLIIQALEQGQDLRGVALAYDKQRYLRDIVDGHKADDLTLGIADWPKELLSAVSRDEVETYYEYADDYVMRDPNGLVKYASWRASEEGVGWSEIFTSKVETKAELDFRLCLASQTPEVHGWYKAAAEYVGDRDIQSYLLRFNATRGTDGHLANWHDVLFWVPNIRRLESGEAKSILNSIQTMNDNQEFITFLPRFSIDRDRFREQGSIQSLRELKKRVFAIESNIDLSGLPPEILEITSAPGFNLTELENLRHRADFLDLVEGKLDKKQPFKPHTRVFAGRPLTDALKEGLGSFKQKIRGTAKDPKGFFHELRQLIKGRTVGEKQMGVTDLLQSVPIDLEEDIIRLLQQQKVDIGSTVEAQVHAKSDPEGWVCGNYTDCCMPFGDFKNTDYMFNPSTQYFTVKYNGRIIAQSVVIDGYDERGSMDKDNQVVILDNIEVANNYKNLSPLLARVYQTFWAEYTGRPVKVGTGYSDLIPPGGKLEKNYYRPRTSVAYSDATGAQIYDLPKIRGVESLDEVVTFANLTERDAELIAKLEATIYPEGMTQGKAHIADILHKQRELDVPGAASSFVVRQGDEAAGYSPLKTKLPISVTLIPWFESNSQRKKRIF
ncbi:hypothetical protein EPN81_03405 [Patescibacteria group bacterium]|nr:MAG: hypothetical protein EPN81_03405 [Patescibacteria group bacterium]